MDINALYERCTFVETVNMHPKHLYEGASLSPDKDLMILRSHSRDSQVSNQQSPLIPKSKLATILIVLDYRTNWVRNAYLCDRRTVVAHGPVTGGGFDKKQRHPPDMHNAILFAENDSLWNQKHTCIDAHTEFHRIIYIHMWPLLSPHHVTSLLAVASETTV